MSIRVTPHGQATIHYPPLTSCCRATALAAVFALAAFMPPNGYKSAVDQDKCGIVVGNWGQVRNHLKQPFCHNVTTRMQACFAGFTKDANQAQWEGTTCRSALGTVRCSSDTYRMVQ